MSYLDIFFIAVGLAMDCFSVAVADGMIERQFDLKKMSLMALMFGLFQGIMPIIGYFAGYYFKDVVETYDHWLALLILVFLGVKMIREDFAKDKEKKNKIVGFAMILLMSIATSIDALATGIVFVPFSKMLFIQTLLMIAFTSLGFTFLGAFLGSKFGEKVDNIRVEMLGGFVLCIIGIKIFIEHICM